MIRHQSVSGPREYPREKLKKKEKVTREFEADVISVSVAIPIQYYFVSGEADTPKPQLFTCVELLTNLLYLKRSLNPGKDAHIVGFTY